MNPKTGGTVFYKVTFIEQVSTREGNGVSTIPVENIFPAFVAHGRGIEEAPERPTEEIGHNAAARDDQFESSTMQDRNASATNDTEIRVHSTSSFSTMPSQCDPPEIVIY